MDDVCIIGDGELVATDNIYIALVELAETPFLGAFTTKVSANLANFERKDEAVFVLYNITSKRYGVVKAKSLRRVVGRFGGFDEFVDLLFGVATGFGEKNFGTFNRGGLDF